jgi:hypothetical protein
MTDVWWVGTDLEGSGRGLIEAPRRNFPAGTEENHENHVRRVGASAEIRPEHLPNASLER